MKYVLWKLNMATGQVIRMMPGWFTTLPDAQTAADCLNGRRLERLDGFHYVVKEVHEEAE